MSNEELKSLYRKIATRQEPTDISYAARDIKYSDKVQDMLNSLDDEDRQKIERLIQQGKIKPTSENILGILNFISTK